MKDLKKANRLIEQIAKEYKEITPITLKDIPLFEKFFKKEPHTYGNSLTYVTQGKYGIGPNGLGYKYYDGKNLSSFSVYPHMEIPNTICVYWTRPMGPNILNIIEKISKDLLKEYRTPTYVKKIFKGQHDYLLKRNFKETDEFPWHSDSPSEDDTFPEIILDVKATVENTSDRETIKNALKRYRTLKSLFTIKKITSDNQKKIAWQIAKKFFKQNLKTLESNVSTSYDFYNPIFVTKSPEYKTYLILKNAIPYGVYDLNKLDNTYYSIYMSLMLREKLRNLNEFSIIYRCNEVLQNGGLYLNMGGSETEGLNAFKNKFQVIKTNKMYWATYC